jgi:hypothetical protein
MLCFLKKNYQLFGCKNVAAAYAAKRRSPKAPRPRTASAIIMSSASNHQNMIKRERQKRKATSKKGWKGGSEPLLFFVLKYKNSVFKKNFQGGGQKNIFL